MGQAGAGGVTALGREGQTGCEGTEWESETSVRCMMGSGTWGTLIAVVTAGGRGGSISMAVSMDSGMVDKVGRSNTGGTGSASITVHGSGLGLAGLTATGRGGQTDCEGTSWIAETSIRCMTGGQRARGSASAVVTIGERSGSKTEGCSFDIQGLSAVSRSNLVGTGSASVTVHGSGLGLASLTALVRGGQTGCEGTKWESETSARCMANLEELGAQTPLC